MITPPGLALSLNVNVTAIHVRGLNESVHFLKRVYEPVRFGKAPANVCYLLG